MGGQSAGNYNRASSRGGPLRRPDPPPTPETPRPIRMLITSEPTPPQPDEVFAPSKGKSRVVVKGRVVVKRSVSAVIVAIALGVHRWSHPRHCFGLSSWSSVVMVCGLWRGSSWWWWSSSQDRGLVDFGSWVRVPPWWVEIRCDRTRRTGTRPGSVPLAELSSSAGGPNKDPMGSISFGCVRVCLWAQSISNNCLSALYITCIPS